MSIKITEVDTGSPAQSAGIQAGDELISINGSTIRDVLDYRFYMTNRKLTVVLKREQEYTVHVTKGEYQELGLEFETYLMDRQHHCKNKCVFCFVDQLPGGLRDTLYFKDDDSRMSFLFGSYVTLTNMQEEDIRRIVKMRLSPVNISVHATNPELRVKLMGNPRSGEVLDYIKILTDGGITVNAQIVICPGLNDGEELRRSLTDLCALAPVLQSVALVPVGLTDHREGLFSLRLQTKQEAADILDMANEFGNRMLAQHGLRVVYPADELFLRAGREIPDVEYYDEFPQLDNGIGTTALMRSEFRDELEYLEPSDKKTEVSLICGRAAEPVLKKLFNEISEKFPAATVHVYGIPNKLFGSSITVSGLVVGSDMLDYLQDKPLGQKVLLPDVMLRHEKDLFLDNMHIDTVREKLGVPVEVLEPDGGILLRHAVCAEN